MNTESSLYVTLRQWGQRIILYGILLALTVFFLIPAYVVIMTSLKPDKDANDLRLVWNLPEEVKVESFEFAWEKLGPGLQSSFLLTISATVLSALMGSMNGYVLSKWKVPWGNTIFTFMLFGMFIPYQATLVPLFNFMRSIGFYNSLEGLVLVHVVYGLPITTLIFRNFYVNIPDEILEASQIDGADFFSTYWHIVLQLSIPGFVVVIIWQFTQIWNEFLFAVTLMPREDQPITAGLAQLSGGQAVEWNKPMAGAIMAALPPLIVYIVAGRYFIRGLLAGSVKG